MTIADLMVGLLCMPIRGMIFLFHGSWIFGQIFCHVFIGIQNALPGVSVFGVVIISIDRCLATTYPLRHLQRKSKKLAVVINAVTWFIPLILWFSISTIWDLVRPLSRMTASGFCQPNYAQHVETSATVVLLRACIPFITILVISIQIYSKVRLAGSNELGDIDFRTTSVASKDESSSFDVDRDSNRSMRQGCHHGLAKISRSKNQSIDSSKALRTLTFLIVAFFITWVPSTLILILRSALPRWFLGLPSRTLLRESARWFMFCNSTINPLAYALAQPLLRKAVMKACCRGQKR
ncbi:trace amine-associated receptor 7e-like [Diadema antillarum]|uniref:trace amine-associated receptor 7e-like n=1 Tax=Diadema antillarum TaxID=105358 RepID=UPI003A84861A